MIEHLRSLSDTLSEKAEDLRSANARLRALINIGLELVSERDADRLLERVCLAARDLFGATYATLGIVDVNVRTLQRVVTSGANVANWAKIGEPVPGILGTVVAKRRTLRGENPGGDPAALRLPLLHPEVQSFLAAPIASQAHVYGWICLVGNEGRPFTEDDEQMIPALAGHVGRIYELQYEITERRALEAQYQQAQKMDAIGRLAGGVAHDFNNLLTAILGYCELLLVDLDPNDPRQADITEIQKAGLSAAVLTGQLLTFSRMQFIDPTLLDLNGVVADMRAMLERPIGEDVKVTLGLRPEPAMVMADRGQIEQIVMNLAVNARESMPRGGTLTIETANVEIDENYSRTHLGAKPGPYVVLTVTDTGAGMTPEVQARLFEPFFTTKEPGKGAGLGLATVHGIVVRNGGTINVYSEVGHGSSFKVYFPRVEDGEMATVEPPPLARSRAGVETVLVVEDTDGLRALARRLLERQGYTVLVAANAAEAVRLFEQHASIDVILADVVLPGASGPELTQQLLAQRPGLKVIYMSGYTEDSIIQHGVLSAGIAFLHKPFTAQTLGETIREVLDR